MDIRMPHLDGIAATRLLRSQPHPPPVLVLTTFDADELVLRALQAGAAGFLLKDSAPADIARAMHMSLATVKAHVSQLLTKLNVANRVQIALLVHDAATWRQQQDR
jgi:DNA-binding NarL/FixJ family response regulator